MTNDEIRIKIAESLETLKVWKNTETSIPYLCLIPTEHKPFVREEQARFWEQVTWRDVTNLYVVQNLHLLPNYPESLDACAEFRKTLTDTEKERYVWWLNHLHPSADIHYSELQKDVRREVFDLIDVKPIEHCVAYLKMKEIIQ